MSRFSEGTSPLRADADGRFYTLGSGSISFLFKDFARIHFGMVQVVCIVK